MPFDVGHVIWCVEKLFAKLCRLSGVLKHRSVMPPPLLVMPYRLGQREVM